MLWYRVLTGVFSLVFVGIGLLACAATVVPWLSGDEIFHGEALFAGLFSFLIGSWMGWQTAFRSAAVLLSASVVVRGSFFTHRYDLDSVSMVEVRPDAALITVFIPWIQLQDGKWVKVVNLRVLRRRAGNPADAFAEALRFRLAGSAVQPSEGREGRDRNSVDGSSAAGRNRIINEWIVACAVAIPTIFFDYYLIAVGAWQAALATSVIFGLGVAILRWRWAAIDRQGP